MKSNSKTVYKKKNMFFILISFLCCSLTAHNNINVKDSLQHILQINIIDAEIRFKNAYNLIFFNSSPTEAEDLGMNILYPFVKKTWKDKSQQKSHLARIYLMMSFCHRERGGSDRLEKEKYFLDSALETVLESNNDTICGRVYTAHGFMQIKRGSIKEAHKYLYKAIEHYDKIEMYVKSSGMLYVIVSNFYYIKDISNMENVLRQMEVYLKKDSSKQSHYQYNVIKHSYFDLLLDKDKDDGKPVDYNLLDSVTVYIKKNITLTENYRNELDPSWMHAWAYLYRAKELDKYHPEQTDSIWFYLDKTIEMLEIENFSRKNESNSVTELMIYVNEIKAKNLFREQKYEKSFQAISQALILIEKLKNYQNLDEAIHTAYSFMVDYYEKMNNPAEALKYQKLLQSTEAERYKKTKIQAINDMLAKYETEKKELQIQTLEKEKQTSRQIIILVIGISIILLIAIGLTILFSRSRRRNLEQRLYETALMAELNQNELDKYQNNPSRSGEKIITGAIEKIAQLITNSLIEKDTQQNYLQRLDTIKTDLLEQAYLNANEKITNMDMKYIICFYIEMEVKDITLLFNIEHASVHTVRYRIKKKFSKNDTFKMIL